jgi:hypothetical protein
MEGVWNWVNVKSCELLLMKAYKDALSYADIVAQQPVAEFDLEDEPGSEYSPRYLAKRNNAP